MSDINRNIEFDGTKQKVLNAVFSTLADAYIDRFIVAIGVSLKLKLFEARPMDPNLFTLTGLALQKQVKIEPIDILATLSDSSKF